MPRELSPAFSYYPKDLMSDARVMAMSAETFGVYWWLVSICWVEHTIPDDVEVCGALVRGKISLKRFAAIWPEVRQCFSPDGHGNLRHRRLDRERKAQEQHRAKRSAAGSLGAAARWQSHTDANAIAMAKNGLPSPSPSASAVHLPSVGVVTAPQLRERPLATPHRINVAWPGRPPVPGTLHEEFVSKLGGDPEDARRRLREWYPQAAAPYDHQPIGDDDFKFWRARFREWVGTTEKPVAPSRAAPMPTYGDEWCYHEPRCNSREYHAVRERDEVEV